MIRFYHFFYLVLFCFLNVDRVKQFMEKRVPIHRHPRLDPRFRERVEVGTGTLSPYPRTPAYVQGLALSAHSQSRILGLNEDVFDGRLCSRFHGAMDKRAYT